MIEKTILEALGSVRPDIDFTNSESFIEDGMLDSFDVISLVSCLDGEFDISIDGMDILAENFSSISSIKAMLEKYL